VPYILVVGDREMEAGSVAVRLRNGRDLGAMQLSEFISMAQEAIRSKAQV